MSRATYRYGATTIADFTPGADKQSGDVVALPENRAGIVAADVLSGILGSAYVDGVFEMPSDSATTADAWELAYLDVSDSNKVIPAADAVDGDVICGFFTEAKTSGQTSAVVNLNATPASALLGAVPTPEAGAVVVSARRDTPIGLDTASPGVIDPVLQVDVTAGEWDVVAHIWYADAAILACLASDVASSGKQDVWGVKNFDGGTFGTGGVMTSANFGTASALPGGAISFPGASGVKSLVEMRGRFTASGDGYVGLRLGKAGGSDGYLWSGQITATKVG